MSALQSDRRWETENVDFLYRIRIHTLATSSSSRLFYNVLKASVTGQRLDKNVLHF